VLRRRALRAAAQGFFVFPVQRGGKTPAVPRKTSWDELATRDRDQINTWWPDGAGLNIGISTGRSGLLVVDLDHGKGVPPPPRWQGATHGRDVLARLAAEAGEPFPDHTLAVTTSTGGLHLYFRAPENPVLRNTAGTLGWCIDTRGKGGYIVGAGSVRGGRAYTVTHRAPIAALPDWLRAALTPRVPAPRTSPHLPVGDSRAERYLAAIVEGETTRVTNAVVHSRNHTLFIAALKLGSLVGAGELGEATAEDSLLAAASRHFGVEDFHDNEARKTIASGIQLGKQSPRHLREPGQVSR
jgi:hypothetical protein